MAYLLQAVLQKNIVHEPYVDGQQKVLEKQTSSCGGWMVYIFNMTSPHGIGGLVHGEGEGKNYLQGCHFWQEHLAVWEHVDDGFLKKKSKGQNYLSMGRR